MEKQKRKTNNSRAKIMVLLVIGFVIIFSIFPRAKTIYELSLRKEALLQQQQIIEVQNRELLILLEQSEQPQEVEKIAREKLGMIKPGEKYIVPVEEN